MAPTICGGLPGVPKPNAATSFDNTKVVILIELSSIYQ